MPYFCGYPSYQVTVTNNSNKEIVYDSDGASKITFARLVNAISYPPTNSTFLILNSTDPYDAGAFTINAIATIETKKVNQTTILNI